MFLTSPRWETYSHQLSIASRGDYGVVSPDVLVNAQRREATVVSMVMAESAHGPQEEVWFDLSDVCCWITVYCSRKSALIADSRAQGSNNRTHCVESTRALNRRLGPLNECTRCLHYTSMILVLVVL